MTTPFDVQRFIDERRMGGLQLGVLAIALLLLLADGFDIFMFGKVAPAIAHRFGTTPASLTAVVVAQQVGLAVGAFVLSPFADRLGRRRVLELCALGFGLLTIGAAFAPNIAALVAVRGLAGIFLAPVVPIALALLAEYTPRRRRTTIMAVGLVGYGLGNAGSAFFTALLLPSRGWQSLFWLCGAVGLVCALGLQFVPESLQFRVARDPADPGIARTLRRLDPALPLAPDQRFVLTASADNRLASLAELWRGRPATTALFWGASFASMGFIALCASWLPSFFQQMAGVPIERFAAVASFGLLGGSVGTLVVGWLIDRVAGIGVIAAFYLFQAACLAGIAMIPFASAAFPAMLFAWSFAQAGGQAGLNLAITRAYPVGLRSTGLGWAGGAGRIGGVIVPLLGGFLLAGHYSLGASLGVIAAGVATIALLIMLLAGRAAAEQSKPQ